MKLIFTIWFDIQVKWQKLHKSQNLIFAIHVILGLDPAGLCFDTNTGNVDDLDSILDPSDAKFVDVSLNFFVCNSFGEGQS